MKHYAISLVTGGVLILVGYLAAVSPWALILGFTAVIVLLGLALVPDWWRRVYIVTLVALVSATSSIESVASAGAVGKIAAFALLVAVTFLTTAGHKGAFGSKAHKWILVILWILGGFGVVSSIWSDFPQETLLQAAWFLAFVYVLHRVSTVRWLDRQKIAGDIGAAFVVSMFTLIGGLVMWWAGMEEASVAYTERHQGFYNNPNMLGLIAALTVAIGVGYAAHRKIVYLWVSLLIPVASLGFSGSRTALVATGAGLLWVLIRGSVVRTVVAALVGTSAALIIATTDIQIFATTLDRFTANDGGDLLNRRTDVWTQVLSDLQSSPLGVGWGAAPSSLALANETGANMSGLSSVHNSYLQILFELGWLSLAPLFLLVAVLVYCAFRVPARGLGAGLIAVTVTGLLIQITESAMFGTGQSYPYIFWIAVLAGATMTGPKMKGLSIYSSNQKTGAAETLMRE